MARGDGLVGSLEDGAISVVTGRIAEALADKLGLASTIAAACTPFIVEFLRKKLSRTAS